LKFNLSQRNHGQSLTQIQENWS